MGVNSVPNLDPTRSIVERKSFQRETRKRFRALRLALDSLIGSQDALGLRPIQNQAYSYASTQVEITDANTLKEFGSLQKTLDVDDVLKYEDTPHITVRYGLFDQPHMFESVRAAVQGAGYAVAMFLHLAVFEQEEQDVLVFDVESSKLVALSDTLKMLPNFDKFWLYHPHMTVAYLKKGTGKKYITQTPLNGKILVFDTLYFSDANGKKRPISLNGPPYTIAPTLNKRWAFKTQDEKVQEFEKWLREQVRKELMSESEMNRWRRYINRGFDKGANRAFNEVSRGSGRGTRAKRIMDASRAATFTEGEREQFLRTTLARASAIEKIKTLQANALSEVRGLSEDLVNRGRRVVVDGLTRNQSPREIAERLSSVLRVSEGRARTIANTELVRAHAEGQLQALEELGIAEVGVAVEWDTTKGACAACAPLDGVVLKVSEAKGMIPRHPNCKCAFKVANVGETKEERKNQKRSKTKIDRAIKKSQTEQGDGAEWGPNKTISKVRPASPISNSNCQCTATQSELSFSNILKGLGLL